MALLRHENIKVLANALKWRKNGVLSIMATGLAGWIRQGFNLADAPSRLVPVPVRTPR